MFVLNALLAMTTLFTITVHNWFKTSYGEWPANNHHTAVIIMSGNLVGALGCLIIFHSYLIAFNTSTIDIAALKAGNPFNHIKEVGKKQKKSITKDEEQGEEKKKTKKSPVKKSKPSTPKPQPKKKVR